MTAKKTNTRGAAPVSVPAGVSVVGSQLRSTNLERDVATSDFSGLYIGARIQDALERLAAALEDPTRTRAWSLTGPYGSGKSTLASLITAVLDRPTARRKAADEHISNANGRLADRLTTARETAAPGGMLLALVTARQEPLSTTLRRAVNNAVDIRWPNGRVPKAITAALAAFNNPDTGSADIIQAIKALCDHSPVLLVIDEFGKTLEYLASKGDQPEAAADLYLLQELAEQAAGRNGLPLYTFTLQHLSFLDYASRSASLQSREWAKIQGRFEDVTFTTEIGDALQLLRLCLDHSAVDTNGAKLLADYDQNCAEAWDRLGLDGVIAPEPGLFADLYPLHPITAIAAPLLSAQVGQHDRSLTGFLGGDEPNSVARFLSGNTIPNAKHASTLRLDSLYDYFLAAGRTTIMASANASRWIEIDSQLAETHGLPDYELSVLKTVALLNLIDSGGALRASEHMILFALGEPTQTAETTEARKLADTLASLVDRSILVYRDFSDEYRIWRGTDVDLKSRIDEIWDRSDSHTVLKVVSRHLPTAVVAGRHSQQTGMLRFFTTVATDELTENITGPDFEEAPDGMLVFHLGTSDDVPKIRSHQPVVVGVTKKAPLVLDAARYVYALEELLEDDTLDNVAKREVRERASQAVAELAAKVNEAFSPILPDSQWRLLRPDSSAAHAVSQDGQVLHGRSFASIVSAACEDLFPETPYIRNELLGRNQLTSQGAKAQRKLLIAMIEHPGEQYLGITGYGPERAMYSGVLEYLGLHQVQSRAKSSTKTGGLVGFELTEPGPTNSVYPAWSALRRELYATSNQTSLEDLARVLMAPPYGVKAGVVPVLLVAALLLGTEDLALFQDGTYCTRLTAENIEVIAKNPALFTVRAAPVSTGQRRDLLDALATGLGIGTVRKQRAVRNLAVLTVAQALVEHIRALPPHARRTKRVSIEAQRVRTCLLEASDPIDLIFMSLPESLGLDPIPVSDRDSDAVATASFGERLLAALTELKTFSDVVRAEAIDAVAKAFRLPTDVGKFREGLAALAHGFTNASLEPKLKGLISLATNTTLTDEKWLDPLVILMAGSALNDWTDQHAAAFPQQALQLARALDRVSHLHGADAEQRQPGIPVQAQLVTVTSPEGVERRTLVRMPEDLREKANSLAAEVLRRARLELGPDGERILLAAVTEQLLIMSEAPETLNDERTETPA